ncbi:MAG TPA: DUF4232 domain-containing protein [Gaiellaceae bacterium]|nr:DUF4232 domain-containing protein [Gaiellaceae bacterium]
MRRLVLVALLSALAAALTGGSARAQRTAAFCSGTQLTGRFTVVPGSAGAGNIVYALTLRNRSQRACAVTGLPRVRLVGLHGRLLPTRVVAAAPNQLTAALITLAHGASARATARFSPDVPGPGEDKPGACEPKAYRLSVRPPGGGATVMSVAPPTSVCEHGQLQFSAYAAAR